MYTFKKQYSKILGLIPLFFVLFGSAITQAAKLYFDPLQSTLYTNCYQPVVIRLDTEGIATNAVDIKLFLGTGVGISVISSGNFNITSPVAVTGIATTGPFVGNMYHFVNVYQNPGSPLVQGVQIPVAVAYLQGVQPGTVQVPRYYISGANTDDSNISSGVMVNASGQFTQYVDGLTITETGFFTVLSGCPTSGVVTPPVVTPPVVSPPYQSYGGGGRPLPPGYYTSTQQPGGGGKLSQKQCIIDNPNHSKELQTAYQYACRVGVTSMETITKADLDGLLVRKHFAKFMSEFSIGVLGKNPDFSKRNECAIYTDIANEDREMKYYIQLACMLGFMGKEYDGRTAQEFYPNVYVDRGQLWTMFSRVIYGEKYNGNPDPWYANHRDALFRDGIITKTDLPEEKVLRGWVLLMIYRTVNKLMDPDWQGIKIKNPTGSGSNLSLDTSASGLGSELFYRK